MRREYPKVPGPGRGLLITLLVLAAIGLGADVGARAIAETRVSSSVQNALGLPERPDIELQGFPFLLQVARGRLDEIEVAVDDVEVEGLPFASVSLGLTDISFDLGSLLGGSGAAEAEAGHGQAVLTERALSRYLQDNGTPVLVKLPGPGIRVSTKVTAGSETTTATAEGPITVEGGRLVFSPDRVDVDGTVGVPAAALAFDIVLPELIPGLRYERVFVTEGTAAIEASLDGAELEI